MVAFPPFTVKIEVMYECGNVRWIIQKSSAVSPSFSSQQPWQQKPVAPSHTRLPLTTRWLQISLGATFPSQTLACQRIVHVSDECKCFLHWPLFKTFQVFVFCHVLIDFRNNIECWYCCTNMTAVLLNPPNGAKRLQYLWKQQAVWDAFLARMSHFPLLVYTVLSFNYGICGTIALLLSDPGSHRLSVCNAKTSWLDPLVSIRSVASHQCCKSGGSKALKDRAQLVPNGSAPADHV